MEQSHVADSLAGAVGTAPTGTLEALADGMTAGVAHTDAACYNPEVGIAETNSLAGEEEHDALAGSPETETVGYSGTAAARRIPAGGEILPGKCLVEEADGSHLAREEVHAAVVLADLHPYAENLTWGSRH